MRIEITNIDSLKDDINKLFGNRPLSKQERQWFAKVFIREVLKARHYRPSNEVPRAEGDVTVEPVLYERSNELEQKARYILDWLAELDRRNPLLHSKLSRITFRQAHQHSTRWHAAMAKAAEKSDRYVEPDEDNAPRILDLGDGWEVFWLKTDSARDIEGDVMGHCIGNGGYDDLHESEAVISIRKNNVVHITAELHDLFVAAAVTKGNGPVPEKYHHLLDKAANVIGLRLFLGRRPDDLTDIEDGEYHRHDGTIVRIRNSLVHCDDKPALITPEGDKMWYQNGELHREDGPAIIEAYGAQQWFQHDKKHRLDGPAVERPDGYKEWWVDGQRHREGKPAVEYPNGDTQWWRNGKEHRDDGPAIDIIRGTEKKLQAWFRDGKLHREDGPARIVGDPDGACAKYWYRHGVPCRPDGGPTEELSSGTLRWTNKDGKSHREGGPARISPDGTEEWYWNGLHHREDGPAAIRLDGSQEWYVHGKKHREDGPAIDSPDEQMWYLNGELHREDGPAIIQADGSQEWWLNGKQHRKDGPAVIVPNWKEEWRLNGKLHREDGPAVIFADGAQQWWCNGDRHRKDGPAVIFPDGTKHWYLNGNRHREGGPAIIHADGREEWYLNGRRHREDGPAITMEDGTRVWWLNNSVHREDGPAVIWPDGTQEWWQNGKRGKIIKPETKMTTQAP